MTIRSGIVRRSGRREGPSRASPETSPGTGSGRPRPGKTRWPVGSVDQVARRPRWRLALAGVGRLWLQAYQVAKRVMEAQREFARAAKPRGDHHPGELVVGP